MKNAKLLQSMFLAPIMGLLVTAPKAAFAWGGRGHNEVCMAATFTVQNEKLRPFLQARSHIMGHLCNIPDTHWKSLKGPEIQLGSSSHYVDADMLGIKLSEIPKVFSEVENQFTGKTYGEEKKVIRSVALDFGSAWWRVDQFHRRNLELAAKIKAQSPPAPKERTSESHPYVAAVNDWMTSMGLMGHFVGDLSQPFHSTLDYDGYAAGHGGIHAYYEENVVAQFGPELMNKVAQAAIKLRKSAKASFLTAKDAQDRARALSEVSLADVQKILKADKLIQPSTSKDEKGMSIKKEAERKPLKDTFRNFEPLVIAHMARSAALLSLFWEEAYLAAGEPNLEVAKSYWFPFKPDFVPLDYVTKLPAAEPAQK